MITKILFFQVLLYPTADYTEIYIYVYELVIDLINSNRLHLS